MDLREFEAGYKKVKQHLHAAVVVIFLNVVTFSDFSTQFG